MCLFLETAPIYKSHLSLVFLEWRGVGEKVKGQKGQIGARSLGSTSPQWPLAHRLPQHIFYLSIWQD